MTLPVADRKKAKVSVTRSRGAAVLYNAGFIQQILYALHLLKENLSNEKRSFFNHFSTQDPEVSLLVGILHVLYLENGKVMGDRKETGNVMQQNSQARLKTWRVVVHSQCINSDNIIKTMWYR